MVRSTGKTSKPQAKPTSTKPIRTPTTAAKADGARAESLHVQQKILNIFRDTFRPSEDGTQVLQQVKGHLYDRNFLTAFGQEDYRQAYAYRWSPSRALCYSEILSSIQEHVFPGDALTAGDLKVIAIGGGAGAELVSLASWSSTLAASSTLSHVHATFVDIADWQHVVDDLYNAVSKPPALSQYASVAAKEANHAMVNPTVYTQNFRQIDVLSIAESELMALCSRVSLVTMMFTLNELYSASIPKTQQLLGRLTNDMPAGSYLLVADSPGSYSTITIAEAEKRYPMQWLLDHTLLGNGSQQKCNDETPKWRKMVTNESEWFRLPPDLNYPIDLENMRYQIHLYQRS